MSKRHEEKALTRTLEEYMRAKLRANHHKSHWHREDVEALLNGIQGELDELRLAIEDECEVTAVWKEAADVANFAAMVADTYEANQ